MTDASCPCDICKRVNSPTCRWCRKRKRAANGGLICDTCDTGEEYWSRRD